MKKIVLFWMLVTIMFVAGCTQSTGFFRKSDGVNPNTVPLNEFRNGRDGVSLEFVKNLPPDQLTIGDTFTAVLKLHNKGAADIEYGKAVLVSTDSNVIISPMVGEYSLKGKSLYAREGEQKNQEFTVSIKPTKEDNTIFVAYSCYPYHTKLVDSVCIDPTRGKATVADKACEMRDLRYSKGQGAPLSVTNVKLTPLFQGDKMKLRVNVSVQNTGGGKVVSNDLAVPECSIGSSGKFDLNDVIEVDVELSDGRGVCKKYLEGLNNKRGKSGSVVCTTGFITRQFASKSPLVVNLYYGYVSKSIDKRVSLSE